MDFGCSSLEFSLLGSFSGTLTNNGLFHVKSNCEAEGGFIFLGGSYFQTCPHYR